MFVAVLRCPTGHSDKAYGLCVCLLAICFIPRKTACIAGLAHVGPDALITWLELMSCGRPYSFSPQALHPAIAQCWPILKLHICVTLSSRRLEFSTTSHLHLQQASPQAVRLLFHNLALPRTTVAAPSEGLVIVNDPSKHNSGGANQPLAWAARLHQSKPQNLILTTRTMSHSFFDDNSSSIALALSGSPAQRSSLLSLIELRYQRIRASVSNDDVVCWR